jgi:hypothetical protein
MKTLLVILIFVGAISCGPNAEQQAKLEAAEVVLEKAHDDSIIAATKAEMANQPSDEEKAAMERMKQDSILYVHKVKADSIEAVNKLIVDKAKRIPSRSSAIYSCPMHYSETSSQPGKCPICGMSYELINTTDTNKNTQIKSVDNNEYVSSGKGGMSFDLTGRSMIRRPHLINNNNESTGRVVVNMIVDKNGNVIAAIPGGRGSTTTSSSLFAQAKEAALTAKFSPAGADIQKGTMTFVFLKD